MVNNSRSYGGISIDTDHKLVRTDIELSWWKMKRNSKAPKMYNIHLLSQSNEGKNYEECIKKKYNNINKNSMEPQEIWEQITKICIEATTECVGEQKSTNQKKHKDKELENYPMNKTD